jgi:hypothetical protein
MTTRDAWRAVSAAHDQPSKEVAFALVKTVCFCFKSGSDSLKLIKTEIKLIQTGLISCFFLIAI